jgi:hypothetical protein
MSRTKGSDEMEAVEARELENNLLKKASISTPWKGNVGEPIG